MSKNDFILEYTSIILLVHVDCFSLSLLSFTLSCPGIFLANTLSPAGKYIGKTLYKKLTISLRFLPMLKKVEQTKYIRSC